MNPPLLTAVGYWRLPMIHWPFLVKQPFHSLCVYTPTLTGMMSLSLSYLHIHHTDPGSVRGYFLVNGRSSFSPLPSASSKRFVDLWDLLCVIAEVPTSKYEAPRGYCCDLELHKSNWSYHSRQSHSGSEHKVSQLWTHLWAPAWGTAVFDTLTGQIGIRFPPFRGLAHRSLCAVLLKLLYWALHKIRKRAQVLRRTPV